MLTAGLPELTSVKDIQYLKVKYDLLLSGTLHYVNFETKMNTF